MVVYGGENYNYSGRLETWELPLDGLPVWSEIHPAGTPPVPRSSPSVVYDSSRNRLVVFGGQNHTDLWELSLSGTPTWTSLSQSGTPPTFQSYRSAIYDPVHDRMILFGGGQYNAPLNDLWILSFSDSNTWSHPTVLGPLPLPRIGHSAMYDPVRNRMLVFGGQNNSSLLSDTWALSLSDSLSWNQIVPSTSTPGRELHTAIYDSSRDRMVVFAGFSGFDTANDSWALDLSGTPAWSQVATQGTLPIARVDHGAIYDPVLDRMVIFGGYWGSNVYQNEAWELRFGQISQWNDLTPYNGMPVVRYGHTAIYDSARDRILLCGGWGGILRNDVWEMPLSANCHWSRFADSDSMPAPREYHSAIIDPIRQRMILFGGADDVSLYNDTWSLDLTGTPTWSRLVTTGTPPSPRYRHTAIYDPNGDRMIVFGGNDGSPRNEVWSLSLDGEAHWTLLTTSGTPPSPRSFHTSSYDPSRHAMIVFGGQDGTYRNDVWTLSLTGTPTWSSLSPAGILPPARESSAALYDSQRDRLIVFGGWDGTGLRNDLWSLSLVDPPAWTQLFPDGDIPAPRESHAIVYDSMRDRLVLIGGYSTLDRAVVWGIAWGSLVAVDSPPRPSGTAIHLAARPNPFRGETVLSYSLRKRGPVSVGIFDVSGRLVRELVRGTQEPGRREVVWNGLDRTGCKARSGVYLIRVSTPDGSASARVAELK
jgi:hypothetical protein